MAGGIVTIAGLWTFVVKRLMDWKSPGEIAVILEKEYGIGDNVLINSLQFTQIEYSEHQQAFIEETIGAGTLGLAAVTFATSGNRCAWVTGGFVLAVLLAFWWGYASLAPRYAGNAFDRFFFALSDVPPVGSVEIIVTPASDIKIAERDDLQVKVDIDGLETGVHLASYPELYWKEGITSVESQPGSATRVVMQPVAGQPIPTRTPSP